MNDSRWNIRSAVGDDLPFIYGTWAQSYRYDSLIGKGCRNSIFFPEYNKVIDYILDQDDTQVLVAHLPAEPNVILGYFVCQPSVIHYVYVKEAFRKEGIAKSLFQASGGQGVYYTHRTKALVPLVLSIEALNYNPFLLFHQKEVQ